MSNNRGSRGFSLIEAVVFIVVLGIGVTGLISVFSQLTVASVDPAVRKQAVAIASSLMEEIQLRGFTICDPDDPAVYTATLNTDCAVVEVIGPNEPTPNAESRYASPRFDNVNDYDGFQMPVAGGIQDITNTTIPGTVGVYAASVGVANITPGELPAVLSTDHALRITVTVTGPAGVTVSLQGYRLRYAPNSP